MRLPDLVVPAPEPAPSEPVGVVRRRRVATGVTLGLGTGLLAATFRVSTASAWFPALGLLVAVTWLVGARLSGPVPIRPASPNSWRTVAGPAMAVGVVAFLGFVAARLVGQHVPVVSGALDDVLGSAEAAPLLLVLAVAVANAVGEEVFFRGAVRAAVGPRGPAVVSTAIYMVVTAATGNVALVAAALVMGTVFSLERLSTRSVGAPIITHVSWSVLVLLALPR